MLLVWILLLTWMEHVLLSAGNKDTYLEFLQMKYTAGSISADGDSGSSLLLTPLIEQKKLKEAREAAHVKSNLVLPGLESYAGYLTVDKKYNSNLWFWYFPVPGKSVEETPWIIWLQGGPGASSLFGLFTEIGPLSVTNEGVVKEAEYSWGRNHSLLFIDNPVGAGFSFTDSDSGYATTQTKIGEQLYSALQQFLTIFPELRKAPLTIAGESYAGKHIPSIGIQIHWHKNKDQPINLYGLAIGNGLIDPRSLQRYSYFAREVGLVDDRVAERMKSIENEIVEEIDDQNTNYAKMLYDTLLDILMQNSDLSTIYNYLADQKFNPRNELPYIKMLKKNKIRRAIHVGNREFNPISMEVYYNLYDDIMVSSKPWLEVLLDNYKVMLYNGHLDVIVPYHPSVNTYKSLNFSGASEYLQAQREPWHHDGRLAGYYKVAGNLTEVMVRDSGHMVPGDQPAAALGLISAFIEGVSLNTDTGDLVSKTSF